MSARRPEECDTLLFEALGRKDLEAAVSLYEPNATFVLGAGKTVTGHAAIREVLRGWLELEDARFTMGPTAFISADGDLAMLRGSWSATGKGPDGEAVTLAGKDVEVVRRQPDGTWLFVIDHPYAAE